MTTKYWRIKMAVLGFSLIVFGLFGCAWRPGHTYVTYKAADNSIRKKRVAYGSFDRWLSTSHYIKLDGRRFNVWSGTEPFFVAVPNSPLIMFFQRDFKTRCFLFDLESNSLRQLEGDWAGIDSSVGNSENFRGTTVDKFDGRTMEISAGDAWRIYATIDYRTGRMTKRTAYFPSGGKRTTVYKKDDRY